MAMDYTACPSLYSFITVRQERFGSLLFNPLTGRELELDPSETEIIQAFTGERNLQEIIADYRERQIVSSLEADRSVTALCAKLDKITALKWQRGTAPEFGAAPRRSSLPGSPVSESSVSGSSAFRTALPGEGPYYSAPKSAVWDITYLCNLHCPHCLTASGDKRAGELTTREAFTLIDNLAEAKLLNLSLSGGEPFLREDLPELIAYAAAKNIRTDIASNGVVITDAVLQRLKDLPLFHIQISLDGIGETHDAFRGRPGAFLAILANIARLKGQGIAVSISTTATSANYREIPGLIDLAYELGASAYKAIPFLPAGRGAANAHLLLSRAQYEEFSRSLLAKAGEYGGRLPIAADTIFSCLLTEAMDIDAADGAMGCSAGYDTLSIGSDGTAYPCPFLQTLPLGNLLEVPLRELWQTAPILQTLRSITKASLDEPCQSCGYAPAHCRGGCRASAYLQSGSLTGCDPLCPRVRTDQVGFNLPQAIPDLK